MAKPMIENNERGITINKALAWTMLVSVAGLIWWGGGTLASLQSAADRLTSALIETREMIVAERANSAQLEAHARVLENSATRQDTRFDALSLSINELKHRPAKPTPCCANWRNGPSPNPPPTSSPSARPPRPAREAGFLLPDAGQKEQSHER